MTDIDWKARAEAAEARLEAHMAYSCDLQRIIEAICHGRKIRTPETPARFHYDMAVAYRSRFTITDEMVERAAEAITAELLKLNDGKGTCEAYVRVDEPDRTTVDGTVNPEWLARAALTTALEGKK